MLKKVDLCKELGIGWFEYDRINEEELAVAAIYLSKIAEDEKKKTEALGKR